jgi:O-antigen/teichoic acid export membrane protein
MSTASRLISGSAASWVRIGINMLAQLALVPLYLMHWSVQTYGIWLAILALVSVMSTLDTGHQAFLGFEFLRLGKDNRPLIGKFLYSGVFVGIAIGLLQIVFIFLFLVTGILPHLLDSSLHDKSLINTAGIILILQGISWLICGSVGGILIRSLAPFGYYPRMAWWGVFSTIITTTAPAIAVVFGAGLLLTSIVMVSVTLLFYIPLYIDMIRLLKREEIKYVSPSLKLGFQNFVRSLGLSGRSLLESARQQGFRLVLTPLSGAAGLAAFSTMRTGANVALQGLNTVTNPLLPELMRFLSQKDQAKSEAAFGTVWIVVVAFMAPAVVVLQAFIGPMYSIWTQGKIPFDPLLFAILSLSVLVYAVAQPAMAVVIGNNIIKPQLVLSALAAVVVIGGIVISVPYMGIVGAGISLLCAELVATTGYRIAAKKWLNGNQLNWPERSSVIAITSVWMAAVSMILMIWKPEYKWLILFGSMIILGWNAWRYWKILPYLATAQLQKIIAKLPFSGFFKA